MNYLKKLGISIGIGLGITLVLTFLNTLLNYVELYKVSNNDKNTQLQQFIGILSNYKSLETAYKILDDLGINEEDSK